MDGGWTTVLMQQILPEEINNHVMQHIACDDQSGEWDRPRWMLKSNENSVRTAWE